MALLCNVCNHDAINHDAIITSPDVTVTCKVCLKRVHLICCKQLLNACLNVQASSTDVYECLLCNSIEGNSILSNLSRQDGNSLNVKLMTDELNRHEIFFSTVTATIMILKR